MGSGAIDGELQEMKVSPDGVRMPEDTASGAYDTFFPRRKRKSAAGVESPSVSGTLRIGQHEAFIEVFLSPLAHQFQNGAQ